MYVWSHAIMNGTGSITKLTVPSPACHMYVLFVQAGQNTNTKQSACVICMQREKKNEEKYHWSMVVSWFWWFHDLGGFMIWTSDQTTGMQQPFSNMHKYL